MTDTYTLRLKNFRSIRDAEIDIAPLTVIYGPNASGKSSLIYGLLTLRNFLTNPAQNLPSLFNYPSISLGGFGEVVRGHSEDRTMSLSMGVSDFPSWKSDFTLSIARSGGNAAIAFHQSAWPKPSQPIAMDIEIPFPYHANQMASHNSLVEYRYHTPGDGNIDVDAVNVEFTWNGIAVGTNGYVPQNSDVSKFMITANAPMELARNVGFTPLQRGFTTPVYNVSNVTPALATDSEVASLLATDRHLEYKVSDYMEMIANRQIRTRMLVGASSFYVNSIPRNEDMNRDVSVSLVNEGFGINQLAYMLTTILYPKTKIAAIEEPEIHLHPSMVRKLVHAMVKIVSNEDKRIIVSTHSETFVTSLLARIAAGEIDVDEVSFILANEEDGESGFSKQEAKSNGQIQGGLKPFIEAELEDIAVFLGLDKQLVQ